MSETDEPRQDPQPAFELVGGRGPQQPSTLSRAATWLREDAREWCRGRSWEVRAPLLLFFGYVLAYSLLGSGSWKRWFLDYLQWFIMNTERGTTPEAMWIVSVE